MSTLWHLHEFNEWVHCVRSYCCDNAGRKWRGYCCTGGHWQDWRTNTYFPGTSSYVQFLLQYYLYCYNTRFAIYTTFAMGLKYHVLSQRVYLGLYHNYHHYFVTFLLLQILCYIVTTTYTLLNKYYFTYIVTKYFINFISAITI